MPETTDVQAPVSETPGSGETDIKTPDAAARLKNAAKDYQRLQAEFTQRSQQLAELRQREGSLQSQNSELTQRIQELTQQLAAMPAKLQAAQNLDYADEDAVAKTFRLLEERQRVHESALGEIVKRMQTMEQGVVLALTNDKSMQAVSQQSQLRNEIRKKHGNLDSEVEDMLVDLRVSGKIDEYADVVALINQVKQQSLVEQTAAQQRAQGVVGGAGGFTGDSGRSTPPIDWAAIVKRTKEANPHMHGVDQAGIAMREAIRAMTGK